MKVQAFRATDGSLHATQMDRIVRDLELSIGADETKALIGQLDTANARALVRQLMTAIETAPKPQMSAANTDGKDSGWNMHILVAK